MDVQKLLEELRAERDLVEAAILNLERLRTSGTKRRGRPPKWLQAARGRQDKDAPPQSKKDAAKKPGKKSAKKSAKNKVV